MRGHQPRWIAIGAALAVSGCLWVPNISIPPVPPGDGVLLYSEIDYGGAPLALNADVHDLFMVKGQGGCDFLTQTDYVVEKVGENWGDCVASLRVHRGWSATLYQHDRFKGESVTVTTDIPNLAALPGPCRGTFRDCVSSIRVRPTATAGDR